METVTSMTRIVWLHTRAPIKVRGIVVVILVISGKKIAASFSVHTSIVAKSLSISITLFHATIFFCWFAVSA